MDSEGAYARRQPAADEAPRSAQPAVLDRIAHPALHVMTGPRPRAEGARGRRGRLDVVSRS
jgi:hypothetical protein